jgi:murein DD-endopeptidase MepM/ murein hydrolase activator NlpD
MRARRRIMGIALAGALALTTRTVVAQSDVDDARGQQAEVRRQQAEAAAQLDASRAEDTQLAAALEDLTAAVNAQQVLIEDAERRLAAAQAAQVAAEQRVAEAAAAQEALRADLQDRAVASFVAEGLSSTSMVLSLEDPSEAMRRTTLLGSVQADTGEVLEQLRVLAEQQALAQAEADAAVTEATSVQAELTRVLAELEQQRQTQAELRAELGRRMANWESEVAELAATDAELTAFIQAEQARRAAEGGAGLAPSSATSSQGFQWPIVGRVGSPFGYRVHPIFGTRRLHAGVDIGAATGTPIHAAKDGVVIHAGWRGGYGNAVLVEHEGGVVTLYAHMTRTAAQNGQTVLAGDVIGYVGSTGNSTGPHLHLEVRVGGQPVDPAPYLP